tara:strand:+ start:277 stop:543 length:267 start_codon:yes stop_codon:yes gene_type:complete
MTAFQPDAFQSDAFQQYGGGGGGGSTVLFFNGVTMAGGVTRHSGISRPTIKLSDAGGGTYNVVKTHEIYAENAGRVSMETYLIDGLLP